MRCVGLCAVGSDSIEEILRMCATPASAARSTTRCSSSSCRSPFGKITATLLTPRSAARRLAASPASPNASSTPAAANGAALAASRTSARTGRPRAARSLAAWPPVRPVAPVIRIIVVPPAPVGA